LVDRAFKQAEAPLPDIAADLTGATQAPLALTARVYSLDGALLSEQTATGIALATQQVRDGVLEPELASRTHPPETARTYFVQLLKRPTARRRLQQRPQRPVDRALAIGPSARPSLQADEGIRTLDLRHGKATL
jgi:hypothetical protein